MFLDPEEFAFTRTLEAAYSDIKSELLALEASAFQPWPEKFLYGSGWDVFGLQAFGKRIEANCRQCPATDRALREVPGMTTAGFSRLRPRTRIVPHVGYTDDVLRCHLGLVTPPRCGLQVGREQRAWTEGRCLVFDDTVLHSAWNQGGRDRVVLLIDFERPAS